MIPKPSQILKFPVLRDPGNFLWPKLYEFEAAVSKSISDAHFRGKMLDFVVFCTFLGPCPVKGMYFQGKSPVHFEKRQSRHLASKRASGAFGTCRARKVSMDEPV